MLKAGAHDMSWEGRKLGKYLIKDILGRGGMGMVFRAVQEELGREVALKVLPEEMLSQNADLGKRFLREASVCSKLSHPNIVRVYDYGFEQNVYYYTMELLEATTLEAMLKTDPILPLATTLRIARDMVEAFLCYHPQGIVHRDLKPSNIMVDGDGRSILTDFGLVKDLGATAITREKVVVGTPMYIAPEMIRGQEVDAATDIYQFGIVLYRMLTGRLPFMGESNRDVFIAIVRSDPPPISQLNPSVPKGLDNLTMNCLEKDRQQRYSSPEELSEDLKLAAKRLPVRRRRAGDGDPATEGRSAGAGPAPAIAARSTAETPPTAQAPARASSSHRRASPVLPRTAAVASPPAHRRSPWAVAGCLLVLAGGAAAVVHSRRVHETPPALTQPEMVAYSTALPVARSALPDPGAELESAIRDFNPVRRAETLDRMLQRTPDKGRTDKRAAEASSATGHPLASSLKAIRLSPSKLYPPELTWPARAARSRLLFDALRYDLCHVAWRGSRALGVTEGLDPVMHFDVHPVTKVSGDPPEALLLQAVQRLFPGTFETTRLFATTGSADTFGFENVPGSAVPKPLASIFETSDTVQAVEAIPKFVVPPGSPEASIVALTHDLDCRTAFLLRVKAAGSEDQMVIPLLNIVQSPEAGWSVLVTRLAPGALPSGTYTGTLSLIKLLDHEVPRPNLRMLFLATRK